MQQRPPCFVGMDVAKDHLDSACRPEPTRWRVAHDSVGIAACMAPLRPLKPALIVLEATGGWQGTLGAALAVAKRPVAVMNPRHLRDFAKATGPWAKTDARDAGGIAPFAAAVRPTPRPLPDDTPQQRDARLQRRRQRLERLVAERHRVALAHSTVPDRLARPMDDLQPLIPQPEAEVATIIRTSPAWRETDDLRQSAPGMGPVLSATLPAALPEGGVRHQRDIAQVGGMAPLNAASGTRSGTRQIRGGRAEVRAVVYRATRTATRGHPVINTFYPRWLARGPAQKVALTAARRTLRIILKAMGTTPTLWNARGNPDPVPAQARWDRWAERHSALWS